MADDSVSVTRFVLKGMPSKSITYTRYGQTLLEDLLRRMKFQKLNQLMSRTVLLDGTEIVCQSVFGHNEVRITAWQIKEEKRKSKLEIEYVGDIYLLGWRTGEEYTYILYYPGINKVETISAPIFSNGPDLFDSWYAMFPMYSRDFISASSPLPNWSNYGWIICVTSDTGDPEGLKYKYALLVSLKSRRIVAWFMIKGYDVIGDPEGAPYVSGYHVEYSGRYITFTQQIASAQNRITLLGPDANGALNVLSVNNDGGYTNYDPYIKAYNPYTGLFTVINPSWSRTLTGSIEPMGAWGGPWWYGDWPSGGNVLTIRTVCPEMNMDFTYTVTCTHQGIVTDEDYSRVGYEGSAIIEGEGAVLFTGIDTVYFPVEAIPIDKQASFTGGVTGIFDAEVYRRWVADPSFSGNYPKQLLTSLKMLRNQEIEPFIASHDTVLGEANIKVKTRIGSMLADDYWIIHTNDSGKYYPSVSHAVGHVSTLMFTRDKNGVKVYYKELPGTLKDVPKIEIETDDPFDVSLINTSTGSSLEDLAWVDITSNLRSLLVALNSEYDWNVNPIRPIGAYIYGV